MILVNYCSTSLILIKIITRFIINNPALSQLQLYIVSNFYVERILSGLKKSGKSIGRVQKSRVNVLVGDKKVGEKFGRV